MTAVQTYKNLFVRSMQYVDRVKSKDHPDVNNFKSLICSMMDKASEGIKGTDRLIGQCIARDSDDDEANVQQTMCAIDRLCKSFETLGFQGAGLKEVADAYCENHGLKQSCDSRRDIMDIVAKLVARDGLDVQVLVGD